MIQAPLLAAILAQAPAPPPAADADSARALQVLERTKTTRATYSLFNWSWVQDGDGGARSEWAAEFHSGGRHRVETPGARVIADCDAQTGSAIDLRSGERFTGRHLALIACGIDTRRPIHAATWLGSIAGRFGAVDRLRIVSDTDERVYAVDRDGILVGAEIYALSGNGCLQSEAIAVQRSLPDGDLFSATSLERSFVPNRFRRVPERRVGDLWTAGRSCP